LSDWGDDAWHTVCESGRKFEDAVTTPKIKTLTEIAFEDLPDEARGSGSQPKEGVSGSAGLVNAVLPFVEGFREGNLSEAQRRPESRDIDGLRGDRHRSGKRLSDGQSFFNALKGDLFTLAKDKGRIIPVAAVSHKPGDVANVAFIL